MMDTVFVSGLVFVFLILPGLVIAGGMLIISGLNPGYLTKHKEKATAVVCLILAVYGASIICTESEGGERTVKAKVESLERVVVELSELSDYNAEIAEQNYEVIRSTIIMLAQGMDEMQRTIKQLRALAVEHDIEIERLLAAKIEMQKEPK